MNEYLILYNLPWYFTMSEKLFLWNCLHQMNQSLGIAKCNFIYLSQDLEKGFQQEGKQVSIFSPFFFHEVFLFLNFSRAFHYSSGTVIVAFEHIQVVIYHFYYISFYYLYTLMSADFEQVFSIRQKKLSLSLMGFYNIFSSR